MIQISDVIKHLLIINVIAFFATTAFMPETRVMYLAMFYPTSDFFQPYQIVSHMFMHANISHLAFNMLSLFFLGPTVEYALGPKKFLILYLAAGFGAAFLHFAVKYYTISILGFSHEINIPVLGASGAVYGVVVAFAALFPERRLQLIFIPVPIKAKYFVTGMLVLDLFFGFSGASSGVAHFAHVGGAITGFLLIYFWKKNRAL